MGGFDTVNRPNAEKLIILIHCKFVHFNQNYSEILT